MNFWIGFVIALVIILGSGMCWACCIVSGDSQKQSEEEFKAFLEEKERVKSGGYNNV